MAQFFAPAILIGGIAYASGLLKKITDHAKHDITLGYNMLTNYMDPINCPWWSKIDNGLYLGAIPLQMYEHDAELNDLGVDIVLSCMEEFELSIDEDTWNSRQIENILIESPDFLPVSLEKINLGVDIVKSALDNNKTIYVHCKAGKGRSVTIVMAYILKYGLQDGTKFDSVDSAKNYIKSIRPQISLNYKQMEAIHNYYETIRIK